MSFPKAFVWSRFGTEAGQTIDSILRRKELERIANDGVFYWGIGNAVGPSVAALVSQIDTPEVLFSPIKSPARLVDERPQCVVTWTAAIGLNGAPYTLPLRSLITSRFTIGRHRHYALVCSSDSPLTAAHNSKLSITEGISLSDLCNFVTGRPIGASQVTAVVQRQGGQSASGSIYPVSFRVKLVPPYFIRLSAPRPVSRDHIMQWNLDSLMTYPEVVTA